MKEKKKGNQWDNQRSLPDFAWQRIEAYYNIILAMQDEIVTQQDNVEQLQAQLEQASTAVVMETDTTTIEGDKANDSQFSLFTCSANKKTSSTPAKQQAWKTATSKKRKAPMAAKKLPGSIVINLPHAFMQPAGPPKKSREKKEMQCFRCQGYGHYAGTCAATYRCFKCSGEHDSRQCSRQRDEPATCTATHNKQFTGETRVKILNRVAFAILQKVMLGTKSMTIGDFIEKQTEDMQLWMHEASDSIKHKKWALRQRPPDTA